MLANPGEEKLFRKQCGYLDFGNAEVLQVPILNPFFCDPCGVFCALCGL